MVLEKLVNYLQKIIKLEHLLTPYTRINLRCIKELNIRLKIINTLEENIGSKISIIFLSNIFSNILPWARETKETINKQDYIKLKSFCITKEIINKIKTTHRMGEHIHQYI